MTQGKRFAVIDIGTNSARMEIAELRPDGLIVVVDDDKTPIRLGESVFRDGRISDEAFARGIESVEQLIKRARALGVDGMRAVGTSALRESENGKAFAKRIEDDTGLHVEIISGSEEARLIHIGVCEDHPGRENVLVLDIGGGSTEIASGRGADLWLASIRAGSARLTEYFLHADPPKAGELRRLESFLDKAFGDRWQDVPASDVCLGTAGTNGAIVELTKREGKPCTLAAVDDLYRRMIKLDAAGRTKLLGAKEANRSDIMIAGLAIARSFLKVSGVAELKYSGRGLRDGLLVEEAVREGFRPLELGDARTLRRQKLLQLGDLYRFDRPHAEHVATLALQIFDQTHTLHEMTDEERDLLEAAAILHDIGRHISYSKHHKHTYYLIKHSELAGFDEIEVEVIANIARYHRKAHPSDKHAAFKELGKTDRSHVQMLAGILRLADACDRRHMQSVHAVTLAGGAKDTVRLVLSADDAAEVERWDIEEKAADLFESAFQTKVTVELQ